MKFSLFHGRIELFLTNFLVLNFLISLGFFFKTVSASLFVWNIELSVIFKKLTNFVCIFLGKANENAIEISAL